MTAVTAPTAAGRVTFVQAGWQTLPGDQGQMFQHSYAAGGEAGCVRRTFDASNPAAGYTYAIAAWSTAEGAPDFAPWNGILGCRATFRPITAERADAILDEVS